jgi:hypothetical protein
MLRYRLWHLPTGAERARLTPGTLIDAQGMANVPFYVQGLPDGRAKAIFTVPESLLSSLTLHPVLCRGGVFRLQMDMASHKLMRAVSVKGEDSVGFLSTEYESPDPEATALAIAHRLENRVDDAFSANDGTHRSMSSYFNFL